MINTLCVVGRLPRNGALLKDLPTLTRTFDEAYALGESLWGPWAEDRKTLEQGVLSLIRNRSAHENSMARDVRLGRKTESLFLAGLATDPKRFPLLTALHARVEALATQASHQEP